MDRDIEQAGDMSVPLCNVAYQRSGGPQRGDRIVRCGLLTGHDGLHVETETNVAWPDSVGGDYGDPAREHRDKAAAANPVPAEAIEKVARWLAAQAGWTNPGPWAEFKHRKFYEQRADEVLAAAAPLIAVDLQPKLLPGENMIVTVARRMIERGENPEINVTTGLLVIIERLTGVISDE